MSSFLHSLVYFLLALGVLVVFHEFGHYWVARRFDVKILRFSVGFGKSLWSRRFGPDETEFTVSAIPLGGYVKMLDEREGAVAENEVQRAFNRKPLFARTAIVLAGPLANFLFAIVAYWLMFMLGISGLKPLVGEITPGSVADKAGLEEGYEIIEVAGRETPTWEAAMHMAVKSVLDDGQLELVIRKEQHSSKSVLLDISDIDIDDVASGKLLKSMGIALYRPRLPATIDRVVSGGAAEQAGLKPGDTVISADNQAIEYWDTWVEYIRARPDVPIKTTVLRDGRHVSLEIQPNPVDEDGTRIGRIGAAVEQPRNLSDSLMGVEQYGPVAALGKAFIKTWDISVLTLRIIGKMLTGKASVENLSGPISIAQYAGQSASLGMVSFLAFLGIVSVSLGVLNLLPVPLLDGGHLLYYLIELIIGKPVSETVQIAGQQIGMVLLLGLMGLAFYNDIARIFS